MEQLDIRSLLENIEKKVYQQEITSSTDVTKLINTEIAKAINLNTKVASNGADAIFKNVSCTTIECYLEHLKAVEAKLQKPCDITAQCKPVEEREINRRLLLILNRLKRYNRE
jgi:maleate cis-trans isomerase